MEQHKQHLVLFDSKCSFCIACVNWLDRIAPNDFVFAALTSKAAAAVMEKENIQDIQSVIVVEDVLLEDNQVIEWKKVHIMGKGAAKVFQLIRSTKFSLGWLYYLPAVILNGIYRFIAKNRHRIFKNPKAIRPKLLP